jgi:hypothetical protein
VSVHPIMPSGIPGKPAQPPGVCAGLFVPACHYAEIRAFPPPSKSLCGGPRSRGCRMQRGPAAAIRRRALVYGQR